MSPKSENLAVRKLDEDKLYLGHRQAVWKMGIPKMTATRHSNNRTGPPE